MTWWAWIAGLGLCAVACTSSGGSSSASGGGTGAGAGTAGGAAGAPDTGAAPGTGGSSGKGAPPPPMGPSPLTPGGPSCPDLFDQNVVRTYALDIAPDVWNSIQSELHDLTSLLAQGNDFVVRRPVVFHVANETVTGASLKLHGQSSWAETVMFDGARAKIRFGVSFDQSDPTTRAGSGRRAAPPRPAGFGPPGLRPRGSRLLR